MPSPTGAELLAGLTETSKADDAEKTEEKPATVAVVPEVTEDMVDLANEVFESKDPTARADALVTLIRLVK